MTYLAGHAMTCALHPQQDFRQPEMLASRFLQQPLSLPYFRAFGETRLSRQALAACVVQHLRQAAEAAGWPSESWHDCPVFIGSASYNLPEYESQFERANLSDGDYSLLHLADDLEHLSGNHRIFSLATACTSSAYALIQAADWLESGQDSRAFVVGVESFNAMTLLHFHSLGLLTDDYRPFAGNGLILGEGIAVLALSAGQPQTGLQLRAQAAATGGDLIQSAAETQARVMQTALERANVHPATICAVKTHGVGTADSDEAERRALQQVFTAPPQLLAFKPLIGHTLGASAALETALLAQALQRGTAQDYRGANLALSDGLYLCNHFGFGGSNTSMVWQWNA